MADEIINDAQVEGAEDPLEDSTPEPTPEGEPEETPEGDEGVETPDPLTGTPYKTSADLVKGYKEIQRLVGSKDREIANLTRQLDAVLKTLQKPKQQDEAPGLPEGDKFWKALAEDPVNLLRQIARMEQESFYKDKVDPRLGKVEGSMTGIQKAGLIQDFLREHPGFTVEDEAELVDVLDATPALKEMPNGLEIAYNQVLANRYKAGQRTKATGEAVAGAKSVAGLGGKKTSLPTQGKSKDPFDEVMDLAKDEQELFKMGRKG